MSSMPDYVLMTPARDEEQFIGNLLESVVKQTIHPKMHIVVSDGSQDGTDSIVNRFSRDHSFINLLRLDRDIFLIAQ
jgi:glycosyltransferase involved in cell wall biosynthesis